MRRSTDDEADALQAAALQTCGRPDCICTLPVNERFFLWALRQWQCELLEWQGDRALPPAGSNLVRGFKLANLLGTLTDFATLMDVLLLGARRAFEIHAPSCSYMSRDEESLIDLCALAQDGHDGSLLPFFRAIMVPQATHVAALRLKVFATALADAGFNLSHPTGPAPGRATRWAAGTRAGRLH